MKGCFCFLIYLLQRNQIHTKMKKLLLSLSAVIALSIGAKAQTPSYNMENWANVQFSTTQQDPVGWASFNILVAAGMPQSVYKVTSAPYEGSTSAKIVTRKLPSFPPVPGYDTVGLLVLGSISAGSPPTIIYGTPYTGRPAMVNFATKYYSPSLDTGWVRVDLTKYVSGSTVVLATGTWRTSATDSMNWTARTIDLSSAYTSTTLTPDSMKIYCSSSSLFRPKVGSSLWVDAFTFNGWVSTNDIDGVKNSVSVYPNPADNLLSLECTVASSVVEVTDIAGRRIGSYAMKGNKAEINTSDFSKGFYIYQVMDKNNKILNRGKFEVAH